MSVTRLFPAFPKFYKFKVLARFPIFGEFSVPVPIDICPRGHIMLKDFRISYRNIAMQCFIGSHCRSTRMAMVILYLWNCWRIMGQAPPNSCSHLFVVRIVSNNSNCLLFAIFVVLKESGVHCSHCFSKKV